VVDDEALVGEGMVAGEITGVLREGIDGDEIEKGIDGDQIEAGMEHVIGDQVEARIDGDEEEEGIDGATHELATLSIGRD
jgi:hypothetical protein